MGYVLGIRASDHLEVASGAGRLPARALIGHLEAAGWLRLSAGAGVQGPRWWDWARLVGLGPPGAGDPDRAWPHPLAAGPPPP
jgi:hypothetical protein